MTIKCAIYTRKSTEHGLDQEFNSLQNQEESCKAYIASQAFNGWQYYKTYSDAAISGGTMERPALKQMLDDMAQIVGVSVRCVDEGVYTDARKIVNATSALKDRTALLIRNQGAICIGGMFDDAEVSAIVFEKGCKAVIETSFLGGGHYINPVECWVMHKVYQLKYSKQAKK